MIGSSENENSGRRTMWHNKTFVGFDTETTGVNPLTSRIVTVSVIIDGGDFTEKYYRLADPGIPIPKAASDIHGITTEKAREEGQPAQEVLTLAADLLAEQMKAGNPVVAFNACYDLTLLNRELDRHGLPSLETRIGHRIAPVLDPYLLDKAADRYRRGKRTLEAVAKHYGVWENDAFHNAEADVLATLRVLKAILKRYPQLQEQDFDSLMKIQETIHLDTAEYFRKRAQATGRAYTQPVGWPISK